MRRFSQEIEAMFDRMKAATRSAPTLTRGLTQQIRMSDWRAVMDSTQRQQHEALVGTRTLPNIGTRIRTDHDESHEIRLAALRNRLLSRYIEPGARSQCWEWRGALEPDGYSRILWGRTRIGGHRASYMAFIADVPDGLVIDHLCRNRACANPWHLEPVTNHENLLRGVGLPALNARKTVCVRGHEFTPENTRIVTDKNGVQHRECKACHRTKVARLKRKGRAAAAVMALLAGGKQEVDS